MTGGSAGKYPPKTGYSDRIKALLSVLIILGLFLCALVSAGSVMQEEKDTVFLVSPVPEGSRVSEILDSEKNTRNPAEVCFYSDLGLERISQKDYSRSTEVFAAALAGNETIFDWRLRGFAEDDREGCVIDRRTAGILFGSSQPGGKIEFQGREYTVRKVLPFAQQVLYIRPQKDKKLTYDRVFIRDDTEGFLMRNGLSGKKQNTGFIRIVMISMVFLLPVDISVRMLGKRKGKTGAVRAVWTLLGVAVLAVVLWKMFSLIHIPGDWIPGQWSDFGFWQRKLQEMGENLRLYFMLPKTPAEAEEILSLGKTAFFTGAGYIFYLKKIHFFRENAK
ncbi:MAG: ABC transporter permease [Blautia sp.]|nr:ABC transporter permease [Blautia sp.]